MIYEYSRSIEMAAQTRLSSNGGGPVTYFCFIESTVLSVPHMEPMEAEDLDAARQEAEALLAMHTSGYAAHVFEGDERVATIRRDPPTRPQFTGSALSA